MSGGVGKTQLVGAFFLFIVGCTKELPYQSVEDKFDDVSKSMIDTEVDYLYVPSTVNTTRTSAASRPYWMGDAKRVRFVFSEDALNVIEVEADDRFQANNLNAKPVLSIPIQHVDYRCREDAYGKCTHQEEQNSALTWEQRNFFKLEPAKLALKEINFLPVTLKNLFSSCYNEVDSQFSDADMKIDQDSLNIKIEKTFKTSIDCASDGLESLSDLTFKVQYHYSFAKLSALASKNYKPYEYTSVDERTFGFFSTKKRTLGVDNNDVIDGEKQYMDRWNPKRSVVYYLSSAFTDPKYENIKTATKSAIQTINAALVRNRFCCSVDCCGHCHTHLQCSPGPACRYSQIRQPHRKEDGMAGDDRSCVSQDRSLVSCCGRCADNRRLYECLCRPEAGSPCPVCHSVRPADRNLVAGSDYQSCRTSRSRHRER